jgi:hypothetical protein
MKGKTLKSKINGALFFVEDLKNDNGNEYYIIIDLASGKRVASGKQWFEKGIMQNLEIITAPDLPDFNSPEAFFCEPD